MAESTSDRQIASLIDRVKDIVGLLGPVTLVSVLLVYFGYIGTRARLQYFGVYLPDMANLSNQNLVLYGLEVAFVPAALVFLAMLSSWASIRACPGGSRALAVDGPGDGSEPWPSSPGSSCWPAH